jgi:serine/threonine protein kinase
VDSFTPKPTKNPFSPESVPEDFEVMSRLGRGAFGEVFKVKQIATGEVLAMKVLDKEQYFKNSLVRYAKAERNVLVMLNHPFITRLHYAFQTDSKLVLLMEYCAGGDLSKLLLKHKRLSETAALNCICELILALEELHQHNVIYRDLKPENILFDNQGHAKITDFGLSKELEEDSDPMAKTFCGTISYIAPEVIRRRGYTKAIDWYTLGVVFFEMLEGRTPYSNVRRDLTIRNIMHGDLVFRTVKQADLKELIAKVATM